MARRVDTQQLPLEIERPEPAPNEVAASAGRPNRKTEARSAARHHAPAAQLLATPGALLSRTHLRELGLERRAIDAVFRALPVVALPGYSRPMIRAEQYLELVEQYTYRDDRVRACRA
jgi:hypothetical protein